MTSARATGVQLIRYLLPPGARTRLELRAGGQPPLVVWVLSGRLVLDLIEGPGVLDPGDTYVQTADVIEMWAVDGRPCEFATFELGR